MTQTSSPSAPPRQAPLHQVTDASLSVHPADILLNLVVAFLAPIFLSASNGDINLARLAAVETVQAYRARNGAGLLAVAQIIAFSFATLGSLCLSMQDDLSLTMVLRLRGNANALSRSAEAHRRKLEHQDLEQQDLEHQDHADHSPEARQPLSPPPAQAEQPPVIAPAAPSQPTAKAAIPPAPVPPPSVAPKVDPSQILWAAACAEAADQITAGIPHLPPKERQIAAIQAAALNGCATDLLAEAGMPPEPGRP